MTERLSLNLKLRKVSNLPSHVILHSNTGLISKVSFLEMSLHALSHSPRPSEPCSGEPPQSSSMCPKTQKLLTR